MPHPDRNGADSRDGGESRRRPALLAPPRATNFAGASRRIGVEIEFSGLNAREAAETVQALFGGAPTQADPHRYLVTKTRLGDFQAVLDMSAAHPKRGRENAADDRGLLAGVEAALREAIGDVGALLVPCEIVCPPVALTDLAELERLLDALRAAGARGTDSSPFYAFGLHLNPDIAADNADYAAAALKAYLLLSDMLRAQIGLDITRRVLPFAAPFPTRYVELAVAADYWPDWPQLIDDYLRHNPTRNRELDLLPLFAWRDRPRVARANLNTRVKPRPAFHYRLPDARLTASDWTIAEEWNRWCQVERLAEKRAMLARMGAAYIANRRQPVPADWAAEAARWLKLA